jgi:hypothetical protein
VTSQDAEALEFGAPQSMLLQLSQDPVVQIFQLMQIATLQPREIPTGGLKIDDPFPACKICTFKEKSMNNDYVRIGINNALQSEVPDIKKAIKDGDLERATKKINDLERTLRNLATHL